MTVKTYNANNTTAGTFFHPVPSRDKSMRVIPPGLQVKRALDFSYDEAEARRNRPAGSAHPSFSMKGRTVQSMLRMMQEWHRSLGLGNGGLTWPPSPLRPMLIEEPSHDPSAPASVWQLMELTNGARLRAEGTALHHCVAVRGCV
jgi:hypothetical protein